MIVFGLELHAREEAFRREQPYGFSALQHGSNPHLRWYVGTEEELKKVGVVDIIYPLAQLKESK